MSSFRSGSRDLRSMVRVHEARGRRNDGGPRRCARAPLALPCMSRPARTHHAAAAARRQCKAQQRRARSQRASHSYSDCLLYALSDRAHGG